MKAGVVSQGVLFRKALCVLLAGAGIFTDVIELANISDPVDTSDESQAIVLVVRVTDPMVGIHSVHQLRNLLPHARAVLLADHPDETYCAEALQAGAWGCLSTMDTPQVLVKAATKVSEGERWFTHGVTSLVIEKLIARPAEESKPIRTLTPRESEVLDLLARGRSDKEVANLLFISRETAHSHVKSIYKKLRVSTRSEATVCYFKNVRNRSSHPKQPPGQSFPLVL